MNLDEAIKLLKEQRGAGNVVINESDGRVRLTVKGMLATVEKWIAGNRKRKEMG